MDHLRVLLVPFNPTCLIMIGIVSVLITFFASVGMYGLLGILMGEQVIPVAKRMVEGSHLAAAWRQAQCTSHIFGLLPGSHAHAMQAKIDTKPEHSYDETSSDS